MYFAFTEMRTAWYLKDKDFAPRELPRPVIIRLTSGKAIFPPSGLPFPETLTKHKVSIFSA